jgi:hypothetical protein
MRAGVLLHTLVSAPLHASTYLGTREIPRLPAGAGCPYFTGLNLAMSAAFVAALMSSAAPSMWAPTRSAGMPL